MGYCQQTFWSVVHSVVCDTLNGILTPIHPCPYIISLLLPQVDQLTSQLALRISSSLRRNLINNSSHLSFSLSCSHSPHFSSPLSLYQVDRLTSQLKEKADWCSELLLSAEQLRRELQERDEEIDKLESRIRELEQALLTSAESLEKVRRGRE